MGNNLDAILKAINFDKGKDSVFVFASRARPPVLPRMHRQKCPTSLIDKQILDVHADIVVSKLFNFSKLLLLQVTYLHGHQLQFESDIPGVCWALNFHYHTCQPDPITN